MIELWEKFELGKGEVNIWGKDLTDFKKRLVVGGEQGFLFTEAYIGRWDLIANEVYGNPYYWWVIPLANDVMDLFDPEFVGQILRVPRADVIWEWLNDLS